MTPHMENLRAGGTEGSEVMKSGKDLKHSEYAPAIVDLQALHLTRRFAISMPVALLLADLAYRSEVA